MYLLPPVLYYSNIPMFQLRSQADKVFVKIPSLVTGISLGSLAGSALLSPYMVGLGVLGLFLFVLYLNTQKIRYQLALFGFGFMLGKAGMALSFASALYPIAWLPPLSPWVQMTAIMLYATVAVLALSLPGLLLGIVRWQHSRCMVQNLKLASLVLVVELLGSGLFSLFMIGEGQGINWAFSFGYSGYLLAALPLWSTLAVFGGVYILTVMTIFVVGCLVAWWRGDIDKKGIVVVGIGLLSLLVSSDYLTRPVDRQETVAIINTSFVATTTNQVADQADTISQLVTVAKTYEPTAIVLPEDSRYFNEFYHAREVGTTSAWAALRLLASTSPLIIDSSRVEVGDLAWAVGYQLAPQTDSLYESYKSYLVPQGEYLPLITNLVLRLMGYSVLAEKLDQKINYRPYQSGTRDGAAVPILFCFESVKPWQALSLRHSQVRFIAHPFSHSRLRASSVLRFEIDTMLRIQSIWSQTPIVSAGNMGLGKLYKEDGSIDAGDVLYQQDQNQINLVRF